MLSAFRTTGAVKLWQRCLVLSSVLLAVAAQAQFTAYNDHYSGANTHPNATAWNVYGTTGGAPGNSGALKDIATGATLPVTLTITNLNVGGGTTAAGPNVGTPAYSIFNGFIDWGNGTLNHAIQTPASALVAHVFTGLDPNKRYRYTCTAVRGGGYVDRWTTFRLLDAQSFTPAHSAGCLTNGTPGASVAANECVISTGDNLAGDIAVWDNIQPSANGTFTVTCTQYTGPIQGGSSAGSYCYSTAAEKLEEFNVTPVPAAITNQPANQTVSELGRATFTVGAGGNPFPALQWYRNGTLIPGATAAAYTVSNTPYSYNGSVFTVTASNFVSNTVYVVTSSNATLTVVPDVTAPTVVGASSSGGFAIQLTFSEPVTSASATNIANYSVTNSSGGLAVTNVILAPDQTNVTLYTAPQTLGSTYTVTINGVRDISAAANVIATNTQVMVTALDFVRNDVGNPAVAGSYTMVSGTGFNVSGAGSDIGGTADQCTFVNQQKAGDFDVKVRVANLDAVDAWSKATLMARETLTSNSVFAAAVATPNVVGCFYQSRTATGGAASSTGSFPSSYPYTWLRLKRTGNVFTGYAGVDGQNWVSLGSSTLSVGSVYLGFAVTGHRTTQAAVAQFRDYMTVDSSAVVTSIKFTTEPLAASSRKTGLVISEIMYKPAPSTNTNSMEFVEIFNSNPTWEDIGGWKLSGAIDYTFPSNTVIQGGAFIVVAKSPAAVQSAYGISGVMGPYTGSLPASGTLRLRMDSGAIVLEVPYANKNPWPVGADGTGHSLVLDRASYGEGFAQAWGISDKVGGSPGRAEPLKTATGLRSVTINEVLAHTDLPQLDYIELYNHSSQLIDVSGCYVSDKASTNKYRIPNGTVIGPRGFLALDETQLGFRLDATGENIYFWDSTGTQLIEAIQFDAQENGIALGRSPDGAPEFYRLQSPTPGTNNAAIRIDDIAINEIMYAPLTEDKDDQYVELYNKSTNAIDLGNWKFTSAISYQFPSNSVIQPKGYFVIARNLTNIFAHYPYLGASNTFGPFAGKLSKSGERIALSKPVPHHSTNSSGQLVTNTLYVAVEEVYYRGGGRWPKWANEGGSSMELIDPRSNHRLPSNWADSDESTKAPWTPIDYTGKMDNGAAVLLASIAQPDRFEVQCLGETEFLLDNVEVHVMTNTTAGPNLISNPDFENGLANWTPQGNHIQSGWYVNEGYGSAKSLRVRSTGNGDTGGNRIRTPLSTPLVDGQIVNIKAKARWLRGWPEFVLRIKGNGMEAYGNMVLPSNFGTPGLPNSQARTNVGPAIYDVVHTPILPAANEPVVVTARVHDPDGLSSVTLYYRLDTASTYTTALMKDDGTGGDVVAGDGIYSATIPGQSAGAMVAFYVQSADTFGAVSLFPANALSAHECLVRFGDTTFVSAFATYRMWMTTANVNTWVNRPSLSNEDVDNTFVVGNYRVIYNSYSHYAGSPYHQGFASPVTAGCHYNSGMPLDDLYLGTDNFNKLHAPGNGPFDDTMLLREQTCYFLARKMGLPWNYRRFFSMIVNGSRKGNTLMEDTQVPGGALIEEFLPDQTDGNLYKLQPWFEFDDVNVTGGSGAGFSNVVWCTLVKRTSTNNTFKTSAYRNNYLARATHRTANDYTNVFALVDAASATTSPTYWTNLSALIDYDEWARIFAVEHSVGNWDSFGNRNAQNMYGYKPVNGKWTLMIWDLNIVLGNAGSDTAGANLFQYQSGQDPIMGYLNSYPPFRRAWYRAYKDLVNGPMQSSVVDPTIDAKYAAFLQDGITPTEPSAAKTFIATARSTIQSTVAAVDVNTNLITSTSVLGNTLIINGIGGIDVADIQFLVPPLTNYQSWPIGWSTVSNWSVRIPLMTNTVQNIRAVAFNRNGQPIYGTNTISSASVAATIEAAETNIVINEIMATPIFDGGQYVELFNRSSNTTFDISGWQINGLSYTFPAGSYIGPRQYLVLAKNRVTFSLSYGASILVFDEFSGSLQTDGETLTLVKPGSPDVVVDKVRYEVGAPWPDVTLASGSSFQLMDAAQDNARAGDWAGRYIPPIYSAPVSTPTRTNDGWRFVSVTGAFGRNPLLIYLDYTGGILLDDFVLVSGTNANVGSNWIRNGNFESPLGTEWVFGTNMVGSTIVTNSHSGAGGLMMVFNTPGSPSATTRDLIQTITPSPTNGQICTLSFWYLPTNCPSTNLNVRVVSSGLSVTEPIAVTITPSNYVPPMLISAATNYATPGAANQFTTTVTPFQTLWINELQAENTSGITDSYGQRDPWIELFNPGPVSVSLDGLYLTSTYTNLTNWSFPSGMTMQPGEFKVIWCDAEPAQTSNTELHTSFRLNAAFGSVALSRIFNGQPQVLDYINYTNLHAGKSYGSAPDGQPFDRTEFYYVTPGAPNDGRSAPLAVFINEWMPSNTNTVSDPADGKYQDWFEVYNPGTNLVDLAGYYFTDNPTNKLKYRVTTAGTHTIQPGGYLLVWADNDTNQNASNRVDLHVGFKLSKSGGFIGLFAADSNQVDAVSYSTGYVNVAQGRIPDGSSTILYLTNATPRAANYYPMAGNTAPVLSHIGDRVVYLGQSLAFLAQATDSDVPAQVLGFSFDPGAPVGATISSSGSFSWTPSAAGDYPITVRVTDSGTPPLSASEQFWVHVYTNPRFTGMQRVGNGLSVSWDSHSNQLYRVDYKDDLSAPSWTFLQYLPASGNTTSLTNIVPTEVQRFFRISVEQP